MTQPTPSNPFPNPPQLPRPPRHVDPTGLDFDRADTATPEPTTVPAGVELIPVGDPTRFHLPEVTPASVGLADDPIARVLYLAGQLDQAIEALTAAERVELVQYGIPAPTTLRAVA